METDLAVRIVAGDEPFPYKKQYLHDFGEYFERLATRSYVALSDAPFAARLRQARGKRPRGKRAQAGADAGNTVRAAIAEVPWGFDRRELAFIVDEAAFAEADVITDLFTEEARMAARVRGKPSPLEAWRSPATALAVANGAFARARRAGLPAPTPHALREAIYDIVPECTLFKASLGAAIYRHFLGARGPWKVFDPFAGWGDRALAAAAAGASYVGVDPNPALVSGYAAIQAALAARATTMHLRSTGIEDYGPAELAADFGDTGADFVLASPPFHDYEQYSADPRQSVIPGGRNAALEDWLADWFLPATDRVWGVLRPGGCLAYYLSDRRGEVTGPLRRHMAARGRRFRGVIACRRGDKRPLPLWVWEKGPAEPVAVLPVNAPVAVLPVAEPVAVLPVGAPPIDPLDVYIAHLLL